MRLRGDDRAQSMQVGAIILFGFLIIAMATYQAQVVPASNSATEFEHAQEVQGQFIDLRSAVLSAASTGNTESTSIALGTRYPQRTFFVNPPPATGSISTSDPQGIRIDNATVDADGNVGDYWDDRNLTFETRSVRYTPRYNEYDDPPDLVYEHSLVAAEFDDAVLSRTGQTVVENGEISLTLIDGNLSQSGVGQRGIDPEVLSQNENSVTLSADTGENITLVLPTTIEGEDQRDDLASEWESEIEADASVTETAEGIRVEIYQEEVQLRLAMVGLGRDTPQIDESGGYIRKVSESTGELTVEVRDRFNNPVSGAEVTLYSDRAAEQEINTRRTDADGQLTVTDPSIQALTINDRDEWETLVEQVPNSQESGSTDPVSGPLTQISDTDPARQNNGTVVLPQGTELTVTSNASSVGSTATIRSGTPIQAIEYYRITPNQTVADAPGVGAGTAFEQESLSVDGNRSVENLVQTFEAGETNEWQTGNHTLSFRAQDASGRWSEGGDIANLTVLVQEPSATPPGSGFSRVFISDLEAAPAGSGDGVTSQSQEISFTLDSDLTAGETVTIDLSDAQDSQGNSNNINKVSYRSANIDDGRVSFDRQTNSDAELVFEADTAIPAGQSISFTLTNVRTPEGYSSEHSAVFERSDTATTATTTFIVRLSGDATISGTQDGDVFVENSLSISTDATVNGNVSAGGSVTMNARSTITGTVDSGGDLDLGTESEISGDVESEGAITMNERTNIGGNIETSSSLDVGTDSQIVGNVASGGDVTMNERSNIDGNIESGGALTVSTGGTIGGNIVSDGGATLAERVTVSGNVDSGGDLDLGTDGEIDGNVISNGDVTMNERSTIRGDVTANNVGLGTDSTIIGDVYVDSASNIECGERSRINGQDCGTYKENY